MEPNSNATSNNLVSNVQSPFNNAESQQLSSTQNASFANIPPVSVKKRSPFKCFCLLGCFILFLIILVGIGVFAYTNITARTFIESIIPVAKYQEANSSLELNKYIKDDYTDVLRSIDLSKLNKDNPIDIVLKDKLVHLSRNNEKLNKLASDTFTLSGKTIQAAFDGSIISNTQVDSSSFNSDSTAVVKSMKGNFTSDIFITYSNYDYSQFNNKDIKKSSEFIKNLTLNEVSKFMPKLNIISKLNIVQDKYTIKGDLNLTYADKAIYFKFTNIDVPEEAKSDSTVSQLLLIQGKVLKIDISKQFDSAIQAYLTSVQKNMITYNSYDDVLKYINDQLKLAFKDAKDSDIETVKRLGNPIRDILIETITNTNLLSSTSVIKPIRDDSDSVCSQGEIDFNNIIDNFQLAAKKIYNLVKKDSSYIGPKDDQSINNNIDDTASRLKDALIKSNTSMKINTCTSKMQNYLTGVGLDLNFAPVQSMKNNVKLKLDLLIIDYNSPKIVVAPKEDSDITNQVFRTSSGESFPSKSSTFNPFSQDTLLPYSSSSTTDNL